MNQLIERALVPYIKEVSDNFRVLLLSGSRQVGKTTLLRSIDEQRNLLALMI